MSRHRQRRRRSRAVVIAGNTPLAVTLFVGAWVPIAAVAWLLLR